ncbi:MAG: RhoGEF domain-containing protein [archaeon]|nr:RhoGEF domain-containing protein [archaeon]
MGTPPMGTLWVHSVEKEVAEGMEEREVHRQELIYEIFETERSFVGELRVLFEFYLRPIEEQGLLDKQQTKEVFGNVETLLAEVNLPLQASFDARQRQARQDSLGVVHRIGDILLEHCNLFKLYAHYASNYPWVPTRLQQLEEALPAFSQFLKEVPKKRACRDKRLSDLLILPLQRICKYPLFLQGLVKSTDPEHPDYATLVEVDAVVRDVVNQINERTRTVENIVRLTKIEKTLDNASHLDIVQRGRLVHKEAEVSLRRSSEKDLTPRPAMLYLCSDVLLITLPMSTPDSSSSPTSSSSTGLIFPLGQVQLVDAPTSFSNKKETLNIDPEALSSTFLLSLPSEKLLVQLSRAALKPAWVRDLTRASAEASPAQASPARGDSASAGAGGGNDSTESGFFRSMMGNLKSKFNLDDVSEEEAKPFPGVRVRDNDSFPGINLKVVESTAEQPGPESERLGLRKKIRGKMKKHHTPAESPTSPSGFKKLTSGNLEDALRLELQRHIQQSQELHAAIALAQGRHRIVVMERDRYKIKYRQLKVRVRSSKQQDVADPISVSSDTSASTSSSSSESSSSGAFKSRSRSQPDFAAPIVTLSKPVPVVTHRAVPQLEAQRSKPLPPPPKKVAGEGPEDDKILIGAHSSSLSQESVSSPDVVPASPLPTGLSPSMPMPLSKAADPLPKEFSNHTPSSSANPNTSDMLPRPPPGRKPSVRQLAKKGIESISATTVSVFSSPREPAVAGRETPHRATTEIVEEASSSDD